MTFNLLYIVLLFDASRLTQNMSDKLCHQDLVFHSFIKLFKIQNFIWQLETFSLFKIKSQQVLFQSSSIRRHFYTKLLCVDVPTWFSPISVWICTIIIYNQNILFLSHIKGTFLKRSAWRNHQFPSFSGRYRSVWNKFRVLYSRLNI